MKNGWKAYRLISTFLLEILFSVIDLTFFYFQIDMRKLWWTWNKLQVGEQAIKFYSNCRRKHDFIYVIKLHNFEAIPQGNWSQNFNVVYNQVEDNFVVCYFSSSFKKQVEQFFSVNFSSQWFTTLSVLMKMYGGMCSGKLICATLELRVACMYP